MHLHFDSQIFGVQRFGGIARYWSELLPRVACAPGVSVDMDLGWHVTEYGLHDALAKSGRCVPRGRPSPTRVPAKLRQVRNAATSWIRAPVAPGHVLHTTYYYDFRRRGVGAHRVVTFFDLIQERFPRPGDNRILAAKRRAAESADLALCISHATAADLAEFYGVPPDRVAVTHLCWLPQLAALSASMSR